MRAHPRLEREQNGTALFEGVTVLFLAQFYGVPLTLPQQVLIVFICILGGSVVAGWRSSALASGAGFQPAAYAVCRPVGRRDARGAFRLRGSAAADSLTTGASRALERSNRTPLRAMSTGEKDAAAVRLPPPLVYLLAIGMGVLLQWLLNPLEISLPLALHLGLTIAVVLLGAALVASAFGLFRSIGQDPAPWTTTPEVINTGVYRRTRNPMYVGLALIQLGIGIGLANGWIVALVPVVLATVYATAIRHEEAYLERKFGDGYLAYKRSVRRWF
ncbi:MAG: cation:dicarboxylase symporter family transporter [bacterium]